MFKKASLKFKLIALFLLVGLLPVIVISFLAYGSAQEEIREQAFSALDMYAALADDELESYFTERAGDATVIATTRDVYQSMNILRGEDHQGSVIEEPGDLTDPMWRARVSILNDLAPTVLNEYGYAVMFITDHTGRAVYSTDDQIMGTDLSGRDYVQGALGGSATWSELFYSDIIHENAMVVATPVRSGGAAGDVIGTLNLLMDQQGVDRIVHEGLHELGETADAYLINADGLLLTNTLLGQYRSNAALQERISTRAVELLSGPIRSGDTSFHADEQYPDYLGNPVLGALEVTMLGDTPVGLIVEIDVGEALAGVYQMRNLMVTIAVVASAVVAVLAFMVALSIVTPILRVSDTFREVAGGDFTVQVDVISGDEIGQMANNLNETVATLSETLTKVQDAADNVSHASEEIASGNQDLSQRTEEQASSLEEVASTIEEVTSSLETSSDNAIEADNLSKNTLSSVQKGETVVGEMQGAMEEITRSSQEIAEIIAKVNDIAFQTNLLALNAAVEAARAGEQGRGFAVVAAEVRNLAGRAAESAQEIEKLIKDSIERVGRGNSLMEDTQNVLKEIVGNNQKTTEVVSEIAASLREQSTAASDIRTAIEELNQVTQQNASLVEEIASASENMNSEAVELSEQVSYFKLSKGGTGGRKKTAARPTGGGGKSVALKPKASGGYNQPKPGQATSRDDDLDFDEADFEKF